MTSVKNIFAGITSDGPISNAQGSRDGALFVADYVTKLGLHGRIINASVGVSITPVTFATTAAWAITQPSLSIDVPAGTAVIPISFQVALQTEAGTLNTV